MRCNFASRPIRPAILFYKFLDPWRDPRVDLTRVLDFWRAEMERAESLTREFQAFFKQIDGDGSEEDDRSLKLRPDVLREGAELAHNGAVSNRTSAEQKSIP